MARGAVFAFEGPCSTVPRMADETDKAQSNPLWDALKKTRTIVFSSDVSSKSVRAATARLLALEAEDPAKPITLWLNTPGGAVLPGYGFCDMLRFVSAPVRVVGAGMVASMGISILLSVPKERRFSFPNTRYMLHQPRFSGPVVGSISDLEIEAAEMVKMKDKTNQEIAAATGQSVEKIDHDTRRDLWLSADEALAYGLVSKIIRAPGDLPES